MITFFPTNANAAQAIGNYNGDLTREAQARIQADAEVQRAQIAARAQQDALRQQQQQNGFLNALRQKELQQQGAYQQGTLDNQRTATQAQMDWQRAMDQSRATESAADRASREKIAGIGANRYAPDPSAIAESNNIATSHADRLNFQLKTILDAQAAEVKKAHDQYAMDKGGWLTTDKGEIEKRDKTLMEIANRYRTQIGQLVGGVTKDVPVGFDESQMRFMPRLIAPPQGQGGAPQGAGYFGGQTPSVPNTPITAPSMSLDSPQGAPAAAAFFGGQQPTAPPPAEGALVPRSDVGRKVHVRFPNGAEAEIPEASLTDAQKRLGAIVVAPPIPAASWGGGGAPGAVMGMRQYFTTPR